MAQPDRQGSEGDETEPYVRPLRPLRPLRYVESALCAKEATCDAWGMRGATYYGAHGLNQRMPLHPHFIPASVQCLVCSLCKNSLVASLQIDTERLSWTSAADTVKDGASVEIEVDIAVAVRLDGCARPSAVWVTRRRAGVARSGLVSALRSGDANV